MVDERKISLCYTNYNRVDELLDSFEDFNEDERVNEIIVSDDHSEKENFELLEKYFEYLPKVKHFRNDTNVDCYRNKRIAIELATNQWCCLWDSDNIFKKDYLDKLFLYEWDEKIIYTPEFASPHFNFINYSGLTISKENISQYIDKPLFETMLNANNFFVNRNEYLKVWDGSIDPVTSDSIYFCYKWLEAGNKIFVVPNLKYEHIVHGGSHYVNNVSRTPINLHNEILNQLRQMK